MRALRGRPDELLVAHGRSNIDLKRSDMMCMAEGEWLNDEARCA